MKRSNSVLSQPPSATRTGSSPSCVPPAGRQRVLPVPRWCVRSSPTAPASAPKETVMRDVINQIAFGWYPYLCLTVFLLGSLLRFDREQYTWKTGSSQLLRRCQLMWGSNLFHIGILIV